MDGAEVTRKHIEAINAVDGGGRLHHESGILTWKARLIVYVAFDSHPLLGRKAHYFFTDHLQRLVEAKINAGFESIYGSRDGSTVNKTGAGYLFSPNETRVDRVETIPLGESSDSADEACGIVFEQLDARVGMGAGRDATKDEQVAGIDMVFQDPLRRYGVSELTVEVKSRTYKQALPQFFVQVSETNPDKRIS